MFSFYEFNVMTILSIFITAIIVYSVLDTYYYKKEKNNVVCATFALICGALVSILVSYLTLEPDNILTGNFYEMNN